MIQIQEKEIAAYFGIDVTNLGKKKKFCKDEMNSDSKNVNQYDVIRYGAICLKYNLKDEQLEALIKGETETVNANIEKAFCEKYNISEDELKTLLEDDNLTKAIKMIEIIKEK